MTTLTSPTSRLRWRLSMRPAACVALALVLAAVALAIVFVFKIGPVVAVLDAQGGHGVHSGDLWAVPAASASALFALLGLPARRS